MPAIETTIEDRGSGNVVLCHRSGCRYWMHGVEGESITNNDNIYMGMKILYSLYDIRR